MTKFCERAQMQVEKVEELDKNIKEKFEKAKLYYLEGKSTKFD